MTGPRGALRREGTAPGRVVAVDLARFVAITGMIATHVAAIQDPVLSMLVLGPSSTLFAVVGGMSAVLATRSLAARHGTRGAAAGLITRGLVLALIGLPLGLVPSVVNVVLVPFGAMVMLLPLFLRLRSRTVLLVAIALAVLGPVLTTAAGPFLDEQGMGGLALRSPVAFLQSLLLTGEYPVRTWLVFGLVGVLLARAVLAARERGTGGLGVALVAAGLPSAAVAWIAGDLWSAAADGPTILDALLTSFAHTGTTGDIVRTTSVAVVVIGTLLIAAPPRSGASLRRPARLLAAVGAVPLTIYVVHVTGYALATAVNLTAAVDGRLPTPWWLQGPGAFLLHMGVALLIGIALHLRHRRGPLEAFVSRTQRDAAALCASRPRSVVVRGAGAPSEPTTR